MLLEDLIQMEITFKETRRQGLQVVNVELCLMCYA